MRSIVGFVLGTMIFQKLKRRRLHDTLTFFKKFALTYKCLLQQTSRQIQPRAVPILRGKNPRPQQPRAAADVLAAVVIAVIPRSTGV
jgi:hypothetical protein